MLADKFETFRIEAFSDAVFAIAITLLIVEIKLPQCMAGDLSRPRFMAFLSRLPDEFLHDRHDVDQSPSSLFTLIRSADETLIAINLVLLLVIAWVPFPTAVRPRISGSRRTRGGTVYSGTFLLIAVIFNLLWGTECEGGMCRTKASSSSHPVTRQYAQGPLLYAIMFLVGVVNGTGCLILSTLLAIYFSLPPRLWERGHGWFWESLANAMFPRDVKHGTKGKDHRLE